MGKIPRATLKSRWLRSLSAVVVGVGCVLAASGPVQAAASKDVDPSLYSSLQWRNIGPNLGGRSLAVAGSTARPNEYYFGATGGGLWKSTDAGTNWAPVTDQHISSSSVGAVAVCPTNPDVVYIGVGEVDLRGDVIAGDGVYKSTDAGAHWTHLGLADTQMIGKIRIDPTNCDRAYVAALGHAFGTNTERGVFRTTDGGTHWQRVLYTDDQTGAVDLAMDPANPNVLYAAMWHVYRQPWLLWDGGTESGLYKSSDGGTTWKPVTANLGLPAGEPIGKIGVSVAGGGSGRVYALVEADGGGLFRSDDGGAKWQLVSTSADIRQRGFYFSKVFADPANPDRVYVGNVSFLRSDNGGATFSTIRTPHSDNHDLWIDPNDTNRMIESNDGGAAVSTNGGTTFTAEDYPTGQFYQVVTTNDDPYLVCGEQQDRNSVCVSSTGGTDSFGIGGGESGPVAVDPRNSNVFYAGNYDWSLTRLDRSGASAIGSRQVNPWPDNPMGYPAGDLKHRVQWTYPLVTNPAEPDAVFTGSQYVMKSTDDGQSWQQISPDLSYNDPSTTGDSGGPITKDQSSIEYYADVFAIAPSTVNKNLIWAGTDDGRIWRTTQGGGTWQEVTPPNLAKFTRVSMIDAGHTAKGTNAKHAGDTAYVAAQNYRLDDFRPMAYRTHNGGKTWTPITKGFAPDDYLWSIRQDPQRSDLLYATTAHGVYVSFNDGDRWQPLRLNLPDTTVYDLKVKGNDLVISTHGRGLYVLDDGAALLRQLTPKTKPRDVAGFHQTVPPVTPIPPVAPPPAAVPPTTHAPDADSSLATLNDPDNPVRSVSSNVSVSYTLKQAVGSASLSFLDENGNVLATNTLPTTAGTRTTTWNLRYPNAVSFPGLIYWAGTNTGPKAPLGTYTARLTVDGQTLQESFDILKDSRLTHVTDADIAAQFDLDLKVRNATNDANHDVINIRACTAQVDDRMAAANDSTVTQGGTALETALNAVQNELYQTKLQASEDPLNYPIKLNDKISALHSVIESVDSRPTDQTVQVFDELNAQLQTQLQKLRSAMSTDVPSFNQLLTSHSLTPISCSAV
ncbi:WD40/YVTN/BNR-like repeat-containing protein [Rugosimonospora africana]|uniref:Sortilin N-terminal domain-containing protein n=1 Tax=Rugosimonospora africana TaxID=556532 RepID=A0A8J3QY74_9ACTN|nr:hypothetical protein [Rugosimonospora africana]GIH19590.1 hypothetical protein Raf01_77620 [Rugosimonospora africana]